MVEIGDANRRKNNKLHDNTWNLDNKREKTRQWVVNWSSGLILFVVRINWQKHFFFEEKKFTNFNKSSAECAKPNKKVNDKVKCAQTKNSHGEYAHKCLPLLQIHKSVKWFSIGSFFLGKYQLIELLKFSPYNSRCTIFLAEADEEEEKAEERKRERVFSNSNFWISYFRLFVCFVFLLFQYKVRGNQIWIRISIPIYFFIFKKKSEFSICSEHFFSRFYGAFLLLIARYEFLRQN